MKRMAVKLILILVFICSITNMGMLSVSAESQENVVPFNMIESSLETIPLQPQERLDLNEYFHFVSNSSSEYDSENRLVVVTKDEPNQVGMLWSKEKFSLSKPAQFDSYLYLGAANLTGLADGLTLTLWAEDDETNIDRLGLAGSSLGIYPVPATLPAAERTNHARNYLAFELDYYGNWDIWNGFLDVNNAGVDGPHTALVWDYGMENDSYRSAASHQNFPDEYIKNLDLDKLLNEWTKLSFSWMPDSYDDPLSGRFIFTLGKGDSQVIFEKYIEDTYAFFNRSASHPALELYWGFTGTTGSKSIEQLVVVKDAPQLFMSTVNFEMNGGSPSIEPQIVQKGGLAIAPEEPVRESYQFGGWYLSTTFEDEPWDFGTNTVDEDAITLYAKWIKALYYVEFHSNGGTGTMNTQEFTYNVAQNLTPNTFTRTGYIFAGWNTAKDGSGTQYSDTAEITVTASMTLYAQWNAGTYQVSFDSNGGTGTMESQAFTYDVAQNLTPNSFTRTGYTFTGWNTAKDGSGTQYSDTTEITVTASITLYAQWNADIYQVSFDSNSGTGTMESQAFTYDVAQNLTPNTFTRTGYTFAGWNTAKDGSGTQYSDRAKITVTASITLYAQWNAGTYQVSFDSNGGTGTMESQAFTYDVAQNLTPNSFTRTGYTFAGWNTAKDGSGTQYSDRAKITVTASITLYAQWNADIYQVSFDGNGGTGTMESQAFTYDVAQNLTPNSFTRTGYTFAGWNTAKDGSGTQYSDRTKITVTASLTLYAQWNPHTYQVSFDSNGGIGTMESQAFTYDVAQNLTPNSFIRTGYTFTGWNTAANGSGTNFKDKEQVSVTASLTLYAQWTEDSAATLKASGDIPNTGDQGNPILLSIIMFFSSVSALVILILMKVKHRKKPRHRC